MRSTKGPTAAPLADFRRVEVVEQELTAGTRASTAQTSARDGTAKGRVVWARVKDRAENASMKLPIKGVDNVRPGLMPPKPSQKHPRDLLSRRARPRADPELFLPVLTLEQVGRA